MEDKPQEVRKTKSQETLEIVGKKLRNCGLKEQEVEKILQELKEEGEISQVVRRRSNSKERHREKKHGKKGCKRRDHEGETPADGEEEKKKHHRHHKWIGKWMEKCSEEDLKKIESSEELKSIKERYPEIKQKMLVKLAIKFSWDVQLIEEKLKKKQEKKQLLLRYEKLESFQYLMEKFGHKVRRIVQALEDNGMDQQKAEAQLSESFDKHKLHHKQTPLDQELLLFFQTQGFNDAHTISKALKRAGGDQSKALEILQKKSQKWAQLEKLIPFKDLEEKGFTDKRAIKFAWKRSGGNLSTLLEVLQKRRENHPDVSQNIPFKEFEQKGFTEDRKVRIAWVRSGGDLSQALEILQKKREKRRDLEKVIPFAEFESRGITDRKKILAAWKRSAGDLALSLQLLEKRRKREEIQQQELRLQDVKMDIAALQELVIDGNNLFFVHEKIRKLMLGGRSVQKTQNTIKNLVLEFANAQKHLQQVVLVFDGKGENRQLTPQTRVQFCNSEYEIADDLIFDLAQKIQKDTRPVGFITSDRELRFRILKAHPEAVLAKSGFFFNEIVRVLSPEKFDEIISHE